MPKGKMTFRKSDIKRAFEAAEEAGVKVSVEIDKSGKLKLVPLNDASEARTETTLRGHNAYEKLQDNFAYPPRTFRADRDAVCRCQGRLFSIWSVRASYRSRSGSAA